MFEMLWNKTNPKLIILFHLLCLFLTCSSASKEAISEKCVLLNFKESVSDPSGVLTSWNPESEHCSWYGVSCNSKSRVTSLQISGCKGNISDSACTSSFPEYPFHGFAVRRWCCSVNKGKLFGKLSPLIGKLSELRVLSLPFHRFSGEIPAEIWGLLKLEVLDLEGNSFTGTLPQNFTLSRNLQVLNLGFNRIVGGISSTLSECVGLQVLNLAGNQLNGVIPSILGDLRGLRVLYLSLNRLWGPIPDISGKNCQNLEHVDLSENVLTGVLPHSFGRACKFLKVLDASENEISGSIPRSVGDMRSLLVLNLTGNRLQGELPGGLFRLRKLRYLSLGRNNLTCSMPLRFRELHSLEALELSSELSSGHSVRKLDLLLKKKLSGKIHARLGDEVRDSKFVEPFNDLVGPFLLNSDSVSPSRVARMLSSDLHGSNSESQIATSPSEIASENGNGGLSSIKIASIISASAILSVLLALVILFFYTRKWMPNSRVQVSELKEITVFSELGTPLTFDSIVQATGNFSAGYCIGSGGFGATYKAEVSPGMILAVKRLSVGRFVQGVPQFHAEIKTLGRVRHPNLVTLLGYHASQSEMFLIYNYLPGGNLENFIQERSETAVDWSIIHKIALDIANALAYLHDECVPRVLHRDVKPSNILLDNDLNAYLSDFGLSRLLGTSETHATTGVAGTFGYVAPEYAMTCRVSEKADVYSYGVVLLELISDKKALDPSFSSHGNGFNIVSWAGMLLRQGQPKDVFTPGLWDTGPHEELVELVQLAVMCTVESLSIRPTMKQVVQRLNQLRPSSG